MDHNILWMMDQDRLLRLLHQLPRDRPTSAQAEELRQAQAKSLRRVAGKIAVIPVQGVVEQRGYGWWDCCSTEVCQQLLDQVINTRDVEAVVLDVDSPGGTVYGVEELADSIYQARAKKPIYAIANSLAASAAYWIATAAQTLVVTPSGDVGSVGVFAVHAEYSQALEKEGITVTISRAGKYKAEFNPFETLTKDARDHLQESVDSAYTKFVKAVARNRGVAPSVVREKFGQGRTVDAEQAVSLGMADKVMTLTQLLERLGGAGQVVAPRGPSMEVLRLRQARRKES